MTALQRFITASGMTNLASGIAVVAWRARTAGPTVAGLVVAPGEGFVVRETAPVPPFRVARIGSTAMTFAVLGQNSARICGDLKLGPAIPD